VYHKQFIISGVDDPMIISASELSPQEPESAKLTA